MATAFSSSSSSSIPSRLASVPPIPKTESHSSSFPLQALQHQRLHPVRLPIYYYGHPASSSALPIIHCCHHAPSTASSGSLALGLVLRRSNNNNNNNKVVVSCKATDQVSSVAEGSSAASSSSFGGGAENWVPVVPLAALPKGERRVIIQDGETILLLWYKDEVFAIENRSPAEGAYSEGLLNAKLTQDGCVVCPTTDSTFDLRTGAIKEWYPKNPVLRVLTPALRTLFVYPVKTDQENIYISMRGGTIPDASAEIVFSGKAQPGVTATDVNVEEVKMVVDEDLEGFGFTGKNELINGKAAVIGFLLLVDFELLTGKGLLKGTGFLDFLYSVSNAFK